MEKTHLSNPSKGRLESLLNYQTVVSELTGLEVANSLLRAPATSVQALLVAFYARRVKRLAPALLAVVFITSLAISAVVPPEVGVLDEHYATGQLALLGFSNNAFAMQSTSYWAQGILAPEFNPFTHTWSLGVEEQFYLLFPLLVVLSGVQSIQRRA